MDKAISRNTILVIDDSAINREIVKYTFSSRYQVIEAENGQQGLELLKDNLPQIAAIILDLNMPVMSGIDFLREYHSNANFYDIPVIVTTSENPQQYEKACLELGASDFVQVPFDVNILNYRVSNAVKRTWFAFYENDVLTGLFKKERFEKETALMLRKHLDKQFAFVTLDIDGFKTYNSFFGVKKGDELIQFIGNLVSSLMVPLPISCYAHYVADSFSMCFPYDEELIQGIVTKMVSELRNYNLEYTIKPSFGVYKIDNPYLDVELMHDRAVLASKGVKGKYDQFIGIYNDVLNTQLMDEQQILNDMDIALKEREFQVYYQPKVSLQTGLSCGAEALIRWKHPQKGIIMPGQFIPVFEKNGFICKLDYYVWEEVCKFIRYCMDHDLPVMPISVNVSLANIYNPNFVENIYELTQKYRISPKLFNLEFTESAFFENTEIIRSIMDQLHAYGFLIFMDDFGSGYSSLNMLKDLPVDVLKIDMHFLPKNPDEEKGGRILAAVIRMAGWLNIPVIVEGVETAIQISFLKEADCDYVQGFYFAKPMPEADYIALLEGRVRTADMPETSEGQKLMTEIWTSDVLVEKLFDNIAEPSAVIEVSGIGYRSLRVNSSFIRRFGQKHQGDLCSYVIGCIPDEENRRELYDQTKNAILTKGNTQCEFPVEMDGESLWLRIKLQYVESVGKKHVLTAIINDITARKRAEEALSRSEEEAKFQEKYASVVLKTANLSAWIFDMRSGYAYRQGASMPLYGEKESLRIPDDLMEKKMIHSKDVNKFQVLCKKLKNGVAYVEGIFRLRLEGEKKYRHFLVKCSNTYDTDGNPYRAIGILQDVSDMQEMRQSYFIEMDFNKNQLSDVLGVSMVNLTSHKLEKVQINVKGHEMVAQDLNYENFAERALAAFGNDKKTREFLLGLNEERFTELYRDGTRYLQHTFLQEWQDSGKSQWLSMEMHLRKRPETGDLMLLGYLRDVDKQTREKIKLEKTAHCDQMTGLYNHDYTLKCLEKYLSGEGKKGIHALFMIDLDDFKKINDTYGHIVGDEVIHSIGEKLNILFRKSDIIGRFGGDEFLVLVKDIGSVESAKAKAKHLSEQLDICMKIKDHEIHFTSCIGVSICEDGNKNYQQMLNEADREMYRVKKNGKNSFSYVAD